MKYPAPLHLFCPRNPHAHRSQISDRHGRVHPVRRQGLRPESARDIRGPSSGETVILVGLKPGPLKVLIELADPTHKVITSETVKFTVPE
jgi:hypothetical protein